MIPYAAMKCPANQSTCPYLEELRVLKVRLAHVEKERDQQAEVMTAMKAELDVLKRTVYGRKSEKMPPIAKELRRVGKVKKRDPDQAAACRKKNKEKRKELETVEVLHSVDREGPCCPTCGKGRNEFRDLGEGRRSVIFEYVPSTFRREEHVR